MPGVRHPMPGVVYPPQWHIEKYTRLGVFGQRGLADALIESLSEFADRTALIGPEGQVTYRELDELSSRFGCALLDMGLQPLDRVIFQFVNSKELIVALLACWKADLIPVCTLSSHREHEITYLAKHSRARAHFIGIENGFDFVEFSSRIRQESKDLRYTVVVRGEGPSQLPNLRRMINPISLNEANTRIAAIERDPFQVVAFQLSGGTTSVPKIIPRFSGEYLYNMERAVVHNGYQADDVVMMPLQIIHNASMSSFTFSLMLVGATSVVLPVMNQKSMLKALVDFRPTIFGLSGGAVGRMKDMGLLEKLDLSRARMVISTNAARQIEQELGVPGVHIYGMTEGVVAFSRLQDPYEARVTTIGKPVSAHDEIRIVEPGTETDLAPGEIGEMLCRGPYTIHGYYDAEIRNREAFTADGYYRSGDLMAARIIEGETFYSYEGRLKDLVNRGGEKINCEEVEHVARRHPAIHDIAIVPMPDPELEERACAFVILAASCKTITTPELMEYLVSEGLAKFKCPERIEVISEFPLTSAGKLDKPALRQRIAELGAGHSA